MNISQPFLRSSIVWLCAAILMISASSARAAVGVWTPVGPDGATVYALAVHPANPRILYAGTESAGVFKSVDGGEIWKLSSLGIVPLGQSVGIRVLVIDPHDPETVYAATVQNGVYRSEDGGRSWASASQGLPQTGSIFQIVFTLALDPRSPRTLYAGTPDGIYRSADGGVTWRRRSGFGVAALVVHPVTGVVYGGGLFGGVFRSTDRGTSWTLSGPGIPGHVGITSLAIDPQVPRRLLAGTAEGIFRSTDSGRTWRPVGANVFQSHVTAVLFQGSNRVYAGSLRDGIFRSDDGGGTWRPAEEGPSDPMILSLASAPSAVYAGTSGKARRGGVFRSTDGGTWEPSQRGLSTLAVQEIVVDPSDPNVLYAGASSAGLFKSTDRGVSWLALDLGLPPDTTADISSLVIDPAQPSTLYVVSRTNGILLRSDDGGETWQLFMDLTLRFEDLALDPETPGALWAAGWRGLYRSEDEGATWMRQTLQPEEPFLFFGVQVDPRDPRILYVSGAAIYGFRSVEYRPRIFRSADGGQTWERRDAGIASGLVRDLALDPSDPSTLYAATYQGIIYRSTDAGVSWTLLPGLEGSFTALAVAPSSPPSLYAAQTGRGVLRSTDQGETWTQIRRGLGARPVYVLRPDPHDPETVFAGTANGGIFTHTVPPGD